MRIHAVIVSFALLTAGVASADTYTDLVFRAGALYQAGEYEASGQAYEEAFGLREGSPTAHYNAACSWSLAGDTERAIAQLESALDRGYRNVDWLTGDEDLAPLHADARWNNIVGRCQAAFEEYMSSINVELYEMFQSDQSDRRGDIDWSEVAPRDEARRRRAAEIIEADELHAPDDFIHAAFIFQHGADSTSYRTAYELAMKAVALDTTSMDARWIAAAAKDRYLQSIGRPQIYGTQSRLIDGHWTLEPYDTTAVTDEERARWGVPPLKLQRERLRRRSGE